MSIRLPINSIIPVPKGKRKLKRNFGCLHGYISGKYWITFGDADDERSWIEAEDWLAKEELKRRK